jgi:hypothetical protein
VPGDALDAHAREDVDLHADLVRQPDVHPAAGSGVLALGVLPDAHHVDVRGAALAQGRGHARQEPDRADVQIEVEPLPDGQEEAPQGDVVGDRRRADRAQIDGVEPLEQVEAVSRHHRPRALVVAAAPR